MKTHQERWLCVTYQDTLVRRHSYPMHNPPLIDNIANITSNPEYAIAGVFLDLIGTQAIATNPVYVYGTSVLISRVWTDRYHD